MPGRFIPNPIGIAEVLESPAGPVQLDIHRLGQKLLAESLRRCPVGKTRRLRDGLRVTFSGSGAQLTSDQEYVEYVIKGTRPHVIEAKGRSLAFDIGGETVFATRVNHPGTKPNNFVEEALKATMGE